MNASTDLSPRARPEALAAVQQLKAFYERFGMDVLEQLDTVYTPDVEFRDPVHALDGILGLRRYLQKMARRLVQYRIRYLEELIGDHAACLLWELEFTHPRLRGGAPVTVRGSSFVKFTSKVYYHEDSYDLGALLYEHLPLVGPATRFIRQRMAG